MFNFAWMMKNAMLVWFVTQSFPAVHSTAPIFLVSNVTRSNFGFLEKFLNMLPPLRSRHKQHELEQQHPAFHVDEFFTVPDTGTVVGGILARYAHTQCYALPEAVNMTILIVVFSGRVMVCWLDPRMMVHFAIQQYIPLEETGYLVG